MRKRILDKCIPILLLLSVFFFFLIFFYKIHALVLFDTDDWTYSYFQRNLALEWGGWNPTRVLPEVLMPLVTLVSNFVFGLLIPDHFRAISMGYAVTLSLLITVMCWFLYRLLEKSNGKWLLLFYFLICHFWIYRILPHGNEYMFRAVNVTCVFFYVIPNLLNCILVLWIMQMQKSNGSIREGFLQMSHSKRGAFVLFIVLAIYSNLWASICLAVYVSVIALFDGIHMLLKKNFSLMKYLKKHVIEICIVTLWAIQQIYEINGGRAAGIDPGPYMQSLLTTLRAFHDLLRELNTYFILSAIAIFLLAAVTIVIHKDKEAARSLLILLTSVFIVGLYLILSCARTGSGYLARPEVHYCGFFFAMLILIISADTIFRHFSIMSALMPLFLAFAVCNCNTEGRTYLESNMGNYSPEACIRVCNDIMQQFLDVDTAGKTEIIMEVPYFQSENNWPIANYAAGTFASHFYKMGITEKLIHVMEFHCTTDKNIQLRIAENLVNTESTENDH